MRFIFEPCAGPVEHHLSSAIAIRNSLNSV